jgi:TonB family protein
VTFLVAASLFAQQPLEQGMSLLDNGDFDNAAAVFQGVVDRDPANLPALRGLASAEFQQAEAMQDPIDKNRRLDDAASVLKKLIALSPGEVHAYYTLGAIAWSKVHPDLRNARQQLGMKPEDPGPLKDFSVRQEMRARFEPVIEDGIANLNKALELDSRNADAMAYMNLLLRSRADIRDTPEQAANDLRSADGWVEKSLAAKRTGTGGLVPLGAAPPPPPMPPPPGAIRVGGNVAAANLVVKVDPVYPPLALQARIRGTVRFNIVIGKDGHLTNITLVSAHPLLVAASQTALQQWVYQPTLVNGQPVPVVTTAEVIFTLPPR